MIAKACEPLGTAVMLLSMLGVQVVAGSNPVAPTNQEPRFSLENRGFFHLGLVRDSRPQSPQVKPQVKLFLR